MREFTKGNTHYRIFDDVTEALAKVSKTPSNHIKVWQEYDKVGVQFGCWQQVLDKAMSANPEVVKVVNTMIEELEGVDIPQPMIHKRQPRFKEDQGDELDNDRLRSGQDYWRVCQRESTVGSQVKTFVINMSTAYDVDVNTIHWRGAAALVLCHLLETAGYQCEIWAVHYCIESYRNKDNHFHAIKLKDAYGAIDVDTISTVISGWFYRSVMHALKERPELRLSLQTGLGAPRSIYRDHLDEAEIEVSKDEDLVIIQDIFSEYSAENLVRRVLGLYAPHIDETPYTDPVDVYVPTPEPAYVPPPPKTKAQLREEERQRKQDERNYRKWLKAYQKQQREV